MADAHLSIGEVLAELRGDYPDITISKIRFLESQGLIDPERTPSGYRKFYPGDVERLRWILHQQKDNFLPLKVIRDRLDELPADVAVPADADAPQPEAEAVVAKQPRKASARKAKAAPAKVATTKAAKARKGGRRPRIEEQTLPLPALSNAPVVPLDDGEPEPVGRAAPVTGASLTRDELMRAAQLDEAALGELESYGLLVPITYGDQVHFDEEGLAVARTAAAFARHGIGPRHLKMYKNFAEREAGIFEQILLPHLRQRNPEARARAQAELEELVTLGRAMRAAMLRRAVARSLGG